MATTLNNSYLNKPVTVAQGGSGVATETAYGLLIAGTTATGAIQNAATGSSGQVYLSGGNAAVGTWTNQNTLGGWVLISTATASSSASIAFTGLSTSYVAYMVSLSAVIPATNATNLQFRVSSNNGSSYDSAAGNYGYANTYINDTGVAAANSFASSSATAILIGNVWSNTSFANNFEIIFIDPDTSYVNNGIFWKGKYDDSTSTGCFCIGEGTRIATQINNAIQFSFSSGNIASGVFKLYGLQT